MGSSKKVTIGYWYGLGLHMVLCRGPVDEIVQINVADKTAWKGSASGNGNIRIDRRDLFGGEKKEGGIDGTLAVLMGAPEQPKHGGLAAMLGGLVPAFRGVCSVFYDGWVCAMSPYPKPWSFRLRRTTAGWNGAPWYPEKCAIWLAGNSVKAMNPAHILWQVYTDPRIARGLPAARLDDAAWRVAADALYTEGFGLCLAWARQDSIESFTQTIIDHIGGVIYVSRATGLLTLKLLRGDYDPAALPTYTMDTGLLGIDEDEATSNSDAPNEIIVTYTAPEDGETRTVRVKNNAAIMTAGCIMSQKKEYPGLPTAELALRVAARDLKTLAGGIHKFRLRLDRRGAGIHPGDVFAISDPTRGIGNIILRAGRCEYGEGTDGTVTIDAAEDVFGLPANSWVGVEPPGYVPPAITPVPVEEQRLIEAPYRFLVINMGDAEAAALDLYSGYLAALAASPLPTAFGFELDARAGAQQPWTKASDDLGTWSNIMPLAADIDPVTTQVAIDLAAISGLADAIEGGAAIIDDEIVRLDAIDLDTGIFTLGRGCCDTVPAPHAAGAQLWMIEDAGAFASAEYVAGTTAQAVLLTSAPGGVLPVAQATPLSFTLQGRAGKPYPPGDFRINSQRYPATITGALTVSWAHRDRLTQADLLIDSAQGNIGPEAGTSYTVYIYAGDDPASLTLKQTVTGLTGTTWTWNNEDANPPVTPPAEQPPATLYPCLRVVLQSVRDGIASLQAHDWTVTRV